MSHFTVLVIGDEPEEQLKPFNENLNVAFKDRSDEFREEYETKIVSEFYCDSNSSWGFRITKELFDLLKESKPGRIIPYKVEKIDTLSILSLHKKYKGYYKLENGKRCRGSQWFEVDEIVSTVPPKPNPTTCVEGEVIIRKISPPKKIALKDKFISYEEYLKHWVGLDDINEQGYYYNPNAKWDWYELGGRWGGYFKLKNGDRVDRAYKKDIDFDGMLLQKYENYSNFYDEFEENYKNGEINFNRAFFEFGVHNIGKDQEHFIPETRENYLDRCVSISTFAIIKDGKWYEKGEMSWWCVVNNEKETKDWNKEFTQLLKDIPDETLLSVYDCHI